LTREVGNIQGLSLTTQFISKLYSALVVDGIHEFLQSTGNLQAHAPQRFIDFAA
jgi:hypothetical protein